MTDLVILSLVASALFSGFVFLAYDWYSTIVWRRQFSSQTRVATPEPALMDLTLEDLPVERVKVVAR